MSSAGLMFDQDFGGLWICFLVFFIGRRCTNWVYRWQLAIMKLCVWVPFALQLS
jgi:hypothetical protein